jgi:tetratricopeptide (TPR) repeat protein
VQSLQLHACLGAVEVAGRLGLSLAQATELFEAGREVAESIQDAGSLARLHAGLAARLGWSGDPVGQRRHLEEAARIAEGLPDLDTNLRVLQRAYVAEFHAGALQSALVHARRGIERAEREGALGRSAETDHLYRTLLMSSANALTQLGRFAEAEQLLARSARLEREADGGPRTGHTQELVAANLSNSRGRAAECLRDAEALVGLAQRTGSTWADPVSQATLGRARLTNGDWPGAREAFERAVARARELELGLESEAAYVIGLAEACARCGEAERAGELAAEAVEIAQRRGTRFWEIEVRIGCARIALEGAEDGLQAVGDHLDRAIALIDETGGEALRPTVLELRAQLAARLGDRQAQAEHLRAARARYEELGADGHVQRLSQG